MPGMLTRPSSRRGKPSKPGIESEILLGIRLGSCLSPYPENHQENLEPEIEFAYGTGMKITRESLPEDIRYVIRGYGPGELQINDTRYTKSLIVAPSHLQEDWSPGPVNEFTPDTLLPLLELDPEIILIGTGDKVHMLGTDLQMRALEAGSGLEIMDTRAACRTYNILMGEGRRVVAGLVLD